MKAVRTIAAALAFAAALVPAAGSALAQFDINPVVVTFSPGTLAASVEITNSGTSPAELEVGVAAWNRSDDAESATPTDDVVASPSIFIVAPGKTQLVRLGLTRPLDDAAERAYRLVATEIPDPSATEAVRTVIRMRFPVFIAPRTTQAAALSLTAARSGAQRLDVMATNGGNVHRKIRSLRVTQGAHVLYDAVVSAYVLARQSRHWTVPVTGLDPAHAVVVRCVDMDGAQTEATLRLQ